METVLREGREGYQQFQKAIASHVAYNMFLYINKTKTA